MVTYDGTNSRVLYSMKYLMLMMPFLVPPETSRVHICIYSHMHAHMLTHSQNTHTQPHTVPYVSTDIMERLLSYLHCGDPPSAGPSPV